MGGHTARLLSGNRGASPAGRCPLSLGFLVNVAHHHPSPPPAPPPRLMEGGPFQGRPDVLDVCRLPTLRGSRSVREGFGVQIQVPHRSGCKPLGKVFNLSGLQIILL